MEYVFVLLLAPPVILMIRLIAIIYFACESCQSFEKLERIIHRDQYGRYSQRKYCDNCCKERGVI